MGLLNGVMQSCEYDAASDETRREQQVWQELEGRIQQQLGGNPPLNQFLQELDLRQKTSPPGKEGRSVLDHPR